MLLTKKIEYSANLVFGSAHQALATEGHTITCLCAFAFFSLSPFSLLHKHAHKECNCAGSVDSTENGFFVRMKLKYFFLKL